ncbi:dysbindin-like [Cydia splendana]|uniref:dysbindin-like n=1 Tax=Cydia splendana TaxID=1100963 RepID=UPI0028F48109
MLSNLKEFISVVQDGLTSNTNLRQTLQEVQKVKNIFKDKQRLVNENQVNCGAGSVLLDKYQSEWATLHENADINAKAADEADKLILELHETAKTKLQTANDLAQNLAHLPSLTASVAQCIDSLKNLEVLMKTVEQDLVEFEDIVERSKMEKWKLDHHYHLTLYKEKKMATLEDTRMKLARENSVHNQEREKQQLAELQARRDNSASAFQQDMARYLASGSVPSVASKLQEVTLEQVQLDDDRTALDQFLES